MANVCFSFALLLMIATTELLLLLFHVSLVCLMAHSVGELIKGGKRNGKRNLANFFDIAFVHIFVRSL